MTEAPKTVPWPYKLFFIFHALIIFLWSLPQSPEVVSPEIGLGRPQDKLYRINDQFVRNGPPRNYMLATGLWQYWDMFSPNPLSVDSYIDCRIVFENGMATLWPYPRMANLNLYDKYLQERFRKNVERVGEPQNNFLWEPFCQRVALEAFKSRNLIPIEVTIIKRYRQIGPPQNDPKPDQYEEQTLYIHSVDTGQFVSVEKAKS